MDCDRVQRFIKQITSMSDENLSIIINNSVIKEFKKGEQLLIEGDVSDEYYFVECGFLRTYYNKGGVEINTSFTFEGNVTTNLKSLKAGVHSEFVIVAGEKSLIRIFERKRLFELSISNLEIMLFTRRVITRLLIESEEHGNWFRIFTPTERYQYIQKNYPQILQRISISHLASYLGVSRETLTRIRRKK